MERYIIVERYADNGELSHRALVDSIDGRELGTDGGEPEDQSFWRDWAWVPDELNKAQAQVEALQAQYSELLEALDCVLAERPLPSGEYVHRVSCSGDRRKPAGTVGVSCSCRVGQQQVEALQRERDKLREATKVICGHCCEPMAIPSKAILQSQLSALQGLVRDAVLKWRAQTNVQEGISFRMSMKSLEATLDATTPAKEAGRS